MTTDAVRAAGRPGHHVEINRELLAEMDEAKASRDHWKILVTAGMGFFTDAYDLFIIGIAMSLMASEWSIASWQKSLVSSLALLASAAGAVFFGRIADRLGRRKIYGFEVLILAFGAIASAFSPNIWCCSASGPSSVRVSGSPTTATRSRVPSSSAKWPRTPTSSSRPLTPC